MGKSKPVFFFDVGGSAYAAQSEPCTEGLDSNIFLARILNEFKSFLKDRIVIEELIARISDRLYNSGWFIPLKYRLVYPDNEAEILTGGYQARYKQANESDTKFGIQLRASFENPDSITTYIITSGMDRGIVRQLSQKLAVIINTLLDQDNSKKYLETIDVAEYSIYDDDIENRDLARGLSYAEFPIIGICFGLSPTGKLYKFLKSVEGSDKVIQALSLFLDTVAEDIDYQ